MINGNEIYIFNKNYLLRNDKRRYLIAKKLNHDVLLDIDENYPLDDVNGAIHPLLALFLYMFDGERSVNDVISKYSEITGTSPEYIKKFTEGILEEIVGQEKGKFMKFADNLFFIPKNVIIKNTKGEKIQKNNDFDNFMIPKNDLDINSVRTYYPLDCIFEVNFKCYTDCIYCYANRRKSDQCSIPIERLKEIIQEARAIGMRVFDLCGGEIFLYDKWDILLSLLFENGFKPYISTKIPISEETIKKLKSIGVTDIQLSIDSIKRDELMNVVKVNGNYLDDITNTLKCLEKEGFKVFTNSQITKFNDKPENIKDMLDFLVSFKNIKNIRVGAVGYSMYKPLGNYENIITNLKNIEGIEEVVNEYKEKNKDVVINFSGYAKKDKFVMDDIELKGKRFTDRVRCSGNFYSFIILPDGKVTICEELYFHPQFIIGDLKKQSIEEVWNSKRALELYKFSKDQVRTESACKTCEKFDTCHQGKGVCWKEVLLAYGSENWDYPDPKCPVAPEPTRRFWNE